MLAKRFYVLLSHLFFSFNFFTYFFRNGVQLSTEQFDLKNSLYRLLIEDTYDLITMVFFLEKPNFYFLTVLLAYFSETN